MFQCAKMEPVVRYVFVAITVSLLMQLVNARPQADLDTLIDEVFIRPQTGGNSNNPESTVEEKKQDKELVNARPQADLDSLIDQVFIRPQTGGNSNNSKSTVEKKKQNEEPLQDPLVCQCVPHYLCQNNTIITDGIEIIRIRSAFLPFHQPCLCPAYNTPG